MTASEVTEGNVAKVVEVKSPEKEVVPDTKRQKTTEENGEERAQDKHEEVVEDSDAADDEQSPSDDDDDKETAASVAKEVDSSNIIPRYLLCGGMRVAV